MGCSLCILPLLGGQISSLLKSPGDLGPEQIVEKAQNIRDVGWEEIKEENESANNWFKTALGTKANTQTDAACESMGLEST